jgi:hypothetical protein
MLVGADKLTESVEKILANIERNDQDELVEIDEVFIIVAVHYGSDPIEDTETGELFYRCTSARYHVQRGLIEQTIMALNANQRSIEE